MSDGDDYEQQWEELDEKVLLAQILAELQRMNQHLAGVDTDTAPDATEQEATQMYQCKRCPETVKADDRERHARARHSAPPGMTESLFSPVE